MTLTKPTDGKRAGLEGAGGPRELAHLLQAVYLAHRNVGSFEGEYNDWARPRPSQELVGSVGAQGGWELRWRREGPFPATQMQRRRIWVSAPHCVRVELRKRDRLACVGVRKGTDWWLWDSVRGLVRKSDANAGVGIPAFLRPPIIDPAPLLGAFWFEPAGTGSIAGRKVLRARAVPREPEELDVPVKHELAFDVEHGTVLRRVRLEEGEPVQEVHALSVRYGGEIDPAKFASDPPDILGPACVDPLGQVESRSA